MWEACNAGVSDGKSESLGFHGLTLEGATRTILTTGAWESGTRTKCG